MRIGVAIPARNEAHRLPATLAALRAGDPAAPIVVADAGSEDETARVAREHGAEVVAARAPGWRSLALNAAAQALLADPEPPEAILFLHADVAVPASWPAVVRTTLARPGTIAGAFGFSWRWEEIPVRHRPLMLMILLGNRLRYRLDGLPYGDQGLFLRAEAYRAIGGFPEIPMLEDLRSARTLRTLGRLRIRLHPSVRTSPRRFLRNGPLRQSMADLLILLAERAGRELPSLRDWYLGSGEERSARSPEGEPT